MNLEGFARRLADGRMILLFVVPDGDVASDGMLCDVPEDALVSASIVVQGADQGVAGFTSGKSLLTVLKGGHE